MTARDSRRLQDNNNTENSTNAFEYMGNGQSVPKDVVSAVFHPSVVKTVGSAAYQRSAGQAVPGIFAMCR